MTRACSSRAVPAASGYAWRKGCQNAATGCSPRRAGRGRGDARRARLEALPLDLADSDSIRNAVDEILRRSGGTLDALFNNAGYGQPGAVETCGARCCASSSRPTCSAHRTHQPPDPGDARPGWRPHHHQQLAAGVRLPALPRRLQCYQVRAEGFADTLRWNSGQRHPSLPVERGRSPAASAPTRTKCSSATSTPRPASSATPTAPWKTASPSPVRRHPSPSGRRRCWARSFTPWKVPAQDPLCRDISGAPLRAAQADSAGSDAGPGDGERGQGRKQELGSAREWLALSQARTPRAATPFPSHAEPVTSEATAPSPPLQLLAERSMCSHGVSFSRKRSRKRAARMWSASPSMVHCLMSAMSLSRASS